MCAKNSVIFHNYSYFLILLFLIVIITTDRSIHFTSITFAGRQMAACFYFFS